TCYLSSHGIEVDIDNLETQGLSVSETLKAYADTIDVDLIVMGAYGHSRLREWLLGGTTREMLKDCRKPIRMSHSSKPEDHDGRHTLYRLESDHRRLLQRRSCPAHPLGPHQQSDPLTRRWRRQCGPGDRTAGRAVPLALLERRCHRPPTRSKPRG